MGEVVNLNQYRKMREKEDKNRRSTQNRVRTSRKRSDRLAARLEAAQREAEHDGKQLENESPDEPTTG